MAIINRDKSKHEQTEIWQVDVSPTITGQTYVLGIVPWNGYIDQIQSVGTGLSGSPSHSVWIQRFVVGSGVTSINIGASLTIQGFGTSGAQAFTVINGLTNLVYQGDALMLSTTGSNTATVQTTMSVVIRCLQDIKSYFGS